MDSPSKSSHIKLLPEHIIDQIKAGEVIERPASLIKELLENALDAGATRLSLHLVNNGLELIELTDNGQGMSFHDLPFAFCRHATSKLTRFEDLYALRSYGFRGEALASLSSVAKVRCTSLTADLKGGKIIINGGVIETHVEHTGHEQGTSFYIKDLFYNTPARLKFIKSKTAEKNALVKVIHGFILNYPHIEFELKWDEKEKEIFAARTNDEVGLKERLRELYGKKNLTELQLEKTFLTFKQNYHNSSLFLVMMSDDSLSPGSKCQYILVNGRQIQDKQIHSLISHFADKLGNSIYSQYFLSLTIDPNDLDVNVHPNKLFVKFHRAGEIMGLLSATLKTKEKLFAQSEVAPLPSAHTEFNFDQKFNLKDLKVDTFKDSPASLEEEMVQATLSFKTAPLFLHQDYCLLEKNQAYYLIQVPKLIKSYLLANLSEEETVPLMISEPIVMNSKIDSCLEELKTIGFELDRLNPEKVVLRSVARNFDRVSVREWFKDFLAYFLTGKQKSIKTSLHQYLDDKNTKLYFDRDLVIEALDHYALEELIQLESAVKLSPENLLKLFSSPK